MDENKLAKLHEMRYEIRRVCGNCGNAFFGQSDWSVCSYHRYDHLKHTEATRNVSIHIMGNCPDHKWQSSFVDALDRWKEFVE